MNYQYDYETGTDAAPWVQPAPSTQLVTTRPIQMATTNPNSNGNGASNPSELLILASMLQNMQQSQTQQTYMLREMDTRIARLEQTARVGVVAAASQPSFERVTWWAIWGLLMLILGGTLTIVIILILMNVRFV